VYGDTLIEVDYKNWPRVRVTVRDLRNPWPLVLFFAHAGDSPAFLGFEVLAENTDVEIGHEEGLEPGSFARLARTLPMYVDYARAEIEWKSGDREKALEALRTEAGKGRRGLPPSFYRGIAAEYEQLVLRGDPHPIKSIAEARPVHKSRASRWITEARRRGYISD
jgi:hypothetical protein